MTNPLHIDIFAIIEDADVEEVVIEGVLTICMEIVDGIREGNPVQTAFIIGDADNVLAKSRQLLLNPFNRLIQGALLGSIIKLNLL
jgi:hypothetical protein